MRFQSVARSLAALTLVSVLASGCAFLIPENPSEPRYNTVLGERRVPQENAKTMGVGNGGGSSMAAPVAPVQQQAIQEQPMMQPERAPAAPMAAPAPAPVAMMDLPPVDPNTQRIAAERIQQQDRSLADRLAFWREDGDSSRTIPSENTPTRSTGYPELSQVPPAPQSTGPGSDAERLAAVRAELERDRSSAVSTSAQVRSAAAAEPSMLPPAVGVAPAAEPVYTAPAPAPYSQNAPVNVPPAADVRGGIATLPPPPMPYTPAPAASAPAPIQMDAIPMRSASAPAPAAIEPIMLRPPVVATPAPQFVASPASSASPTYNSMQPAAGSFDPMAGASYGSATANNGYLPVSRYSSYRR